MKHPGDPTPRSADAVRADRNYKVVVSEQFPTLGGGLNMMIIVMHCGTETYWKTEYEALHPDVAMTWYQVKPVVHVHTTYERVQP